MRQRGEDLVELLVALRLAALGAAAAPQQTHLELGLEDLVDFRSLVQACGRKREVTDMNPPMGGAKVGSPGEQTEAGPIHEIEEKTQMRADRYRQADQ